MKQITAFLFILLLFACTEGKQEKVAIITPPRVEMLTNPTGIDQEPLRFMWQLKADVNDVYQTAYQIMVATNHKNLEKEKDLVWNSGKVSSDNSIYIPYEGKPLESRQTYYWKVKVWTNKGETPWTVPNHFTMAFMDSSDWQAKWIGLAGKMDRTG
ncbi:MAG: hypothetical protein LUE98_08060 [Tannerellaceae bacterium]|nr:hypothetical protein [Tannerellaceae bacterium]